MATCCTPSKQPSFVDHQATVARLVAAISLLGLITVLLPSTAYPQKAGFEQQEAFAPYWSSEPGWETELQMKNNLASGSLTVTPVLRLASGQEIPLDPVTILSNDSASVWVDQALLKRSLGLFNQPGSYGSVVFRFASPHAMNLHAATVLTIPGEPIGFHFPAHAAWEAEGSPSLQQTSLEGIWWQPRPGMKDVLVISNSSGNRTSGTLSLFDAGGKRWSRRLFCRRRVASGHDPQCNHRHHQRQHPCHRRLAHAAL